MAQGKITAKQKEILEYIKVQILERGYPPAVREICEAVHLKSTSSVHSHLETLEKNGYITSFPGVGENGGKKRTYYQITDEGRLYYQSKCEEWALTKEVIEKFIVKEN